MALLLVGWLIVAQSLGSPIVVAPPPEPKASTSSSNVSVNVQAPAPDPAATQAMYRYEIATGEHDHASVPVTWASALLKGANIWTRTPPEFNNIDIVRTLRNAARNAALGLFLLGVIWTGLQIVAGTGTGSTSYQQVLPLVIAGFLLAWYSETIVLHAIAVCNWLNNLFGNPSLADFSTEPLDMPELPAIADAPGILKIPAEFTSGIIGSLVYAIVLIILELKMIFREGILLFSDVVMPISGVLWAFQITRGWGLQLYRLFFGSLFGQPLVVICLTLASSLLTFMNLTDGPSQFLVKIAILFLAIKMLSFLSGASISGGGLFGAAGLLFLLRRVQGIGRGRGTTTNSGNQPPPQNAPVVQSGQAHGSGSGNAATGRAWRPAMGTA